MRTALEKAGIKAIWNFAHTDLVVPDDVVVENVHLSESLMRAVLPGMQHAGSEGEGKSQAKGKEAK